jgi:hypothetical protein
MIRGEIAIGNMGIYRFQPIFCAVRNGSSSLSAVLSGEISRLINSATELRKQVHTG